jgi:excisionase family DNA binding protein
MAGMEEWVDVRGAAELLDVGVRRVQQLIASGSLPAERFAGGWRVDRAAVERRNRHRPVGRPYARAVAWRVLGVLDSSLEVPPPDDRAQSARIRRYAAEVVGGDVGGLRDRADHLRFRVHRGVAPRLEEEIVVSGLEVLEGRGGERLVGDVDRSEGYVRASQLDRLVSSYALRPVASGENCVLHVVADDLWPFAPGCDRAGLPVAAVDAMELDDERVARVARAALADAG